ncbi:MAG: hypothetical protein Q9209_004914 [Squamulea sp. 1 TL-2023]
MEEQRLLSAYKRLQLGPTPFSSASVVRHATDEGSPDPRLSFSRAYSISLSPHLIYARSNLVPALVSNKVYRQLEFLAVGSWWIYNAKAAHQEETFEGTNKIGRDQGGFLRKIPGSREDVFADKSIDLRSTRSLMKILKFAADPEAYPAVIGEHGDRFFPEFLAWQYKIDAKLQAPLQALTLAPDPPSKILVAYAVPRLHRHLTSIGIFGPGFGAVVPKWGGLAEIAQVACRAGAVGGGVYVLKKGIESIDVTTQASVSPTDTEGTAHPQSTVKLQGGDEVKARWVVGTHSTLQGSSSKTTKQQTRIVEITHLTAVVSSPLISLFPPPAEGSPPPASIVVVLHPGSVELPRSVNIAEVPAIYLIIHSSDTGECPEGQSPQWLSSAINTFLSAVPNEPAPPDVLWTLTYKQYHSVPISPPSSLRTDSQAQADFESTQQCSVVYLQDLGPSLALEDDVLNDVRAVWERITADDRDRRGAFMQFEDRVGVGVEEDDMY